MNLYGTFLDEAAFVSCGSRSHDWVWNAKIQLYICRSCGEEKRWYR